MSVPVLCQCGHLRESHFTHGLLGSQIGACSISVDTRHVSAGGDGLRSCPCKRFAPMGVVPFGNVPAGLYGEQETR